MYNKAIDTGKKCMTKNLFVKRLLKIAATNERQPKKCSENSCSGAGVSGSVLVF